MSLIALSIYYFVAVILLAHFFAPVEYQWTVNTVSELASQGLANQWIQQMGFIGFGLLLNAGFIRKFVNAKRVFYQDIPIMIYGLAVGLSGIFSTAPFLENVSYSESEAQLHTVFATLAGIAFSISIVIYIFQASSAKEKFFHTLFLILVVGSSAAFGFAEEGSLAIGKGVVQRCLYFVSFIWLLVGQTLKQKSEGQDIARSG